MRYILLLMIVSLNMSLAFCQEKKEIEVSFFKGSKEIGDVKYYLVKGNDASLLNRNGNKIILDVKDIKDNEEIKLLALYKNCKVEFFVKPKHMYYLKISKIPFSFKYFLKSMYVVNQGFDSEEIVRKSKKKYNFTE